MSKMDQALIVAWIGVLSILLWYTAKTLDRMQMTSCLTASYEWIDGDCVRGKP